jgi:hypothetical protein
MRRSRGRPRKLADNSKLVSVRLPTSLLRRVDAFAKTRLRIADKPATRADALRFLLEMALEQTRRDDLELHETFRELVAAVSPRGRRASRSR